DRVEIFMARDRDLKEYYGFEIDPLGRVLDYSASYYRQYKRDWTCAEMETAATITETGYIVEGSLPMKMIRNITDTDILRAGIFRGEFHYGDKSDIIQHWISWVDPATEIPDFHVPTAFGAFKFIELQ
ncbi:MAG: endoxylanase, partial [Candidatus Lokiarchaeota archaeon]|nr:endoxylanase [Candidatus Lokiarchaeota archaeon]